MAIIATAHVPASHRLIDADTAVIPAATGRAALAWQAFATRDVASVHQAAAQLGVTVGEVYDLALDHIAAQTSWTGGIGRRPTPDVDTMPCPAWCTADHTEDDADRLHTRDMGEMTAPSGADLREEKFIGVDLQQLAAADLPGGIDPATIYFTMGDQGGNQIESSAYLSPELAEQLAARLFEAARLARQARR
ncbi:DUF6907 domain-containing protein [Micromonospora coerulea]|uniref:DUF6907 domain-containing protein n=1 Tax=Micromonospora coerulea TaxID=47856 RepID=UPI0019031781|nr:hypothetical protein [Micromonospora veneta]